MKGSEILGRMSYKSGRKKNYPCLRCKEHVKLTEKAVQCALCDLWVHKSCEGMSDETFNVLDTQNEETGQCFWSCSSCQNYARKFDKRMRDVEKRMQQLEKEKIPTLENDLKDAKDDIKDLKKVTEKLTTVCNENDGSSQAKVTSAVLEEMKERDSRRCNLIVHNIAEPGAEFVESQERVLKDTESLQDLLNVIGAEVVVKDASRFVKRLGTRSEDAGSPRPLLVGFKTVDHCNTILDVSPSLSEKGEPWCSVNVVRDLTKTQRKEEKKLREDADKKNSELTDEEKENWQWKVVGRRGERKIVKAAVNQDEDTNERGREGGRGRGRGRARGRPRRNQRHINTVQA